MNLDYRSPVLLDAAHRHEQAGHGRYVCAECRYAELLAVQPRAVCVNPAAAFKGRVLFTGQPACADFVPQRGAATRLGSFAVMYGTKSAAGTRLDHAGQKRSDRPAPPPRSAY